MSTLTLSNMQVQAIESIKQWYLSANEQYFVLAGFAGTGKTFLIQHAIQELGLSRHEVLFGTFTGKAASVLTLKAGGRFICHTLHHVMYEPVLSKDGSIDFLLRTTSNFNHIKLMVVDECSMVPKEILEDLISLGIRILFVGDHGQLEPIGEKTWLYEKLQDADYTLTEIHRQAEGNPIIHLSMLARQGKKIEKGNYKGLVFVTSKRDMNRKAGLQKSLLSADQVICGYNKTRTALNHQIREAKGFSGKYPQEGEKIICLRNNWKRDISSCSLVNGLIGYAKDVHYNRANNEFRQHIALSFMPDFTTDEWFNDIKILPQQFLGLDVKLNRDEYGVYDSFDFGHAVTCHKSQGSQWNNVFVVNEAFGDEPRRWLYTAITRAEKKLILAM